MRYFLIIEQPTKKTIRAFAEKRNLAEYFPESYHHPQEDYLIASSSSWVNLNRYDHPPPPPSKAVWFAQPLFSFLDF